MGALTRVIRKILPKDRLPVLLTGLLVTGAFLGMYVAQPAALRFLDYRFYDMLLRQSYTEKTAGAVVIVDIDEASLKAVGQWPWPRYRVAQLLEKLRLAGVMAVGLDILFSEADRTSPVKLKEQIKADFKLDVDFGALPEQLQDNDVILGGVLSRGPFVPAFYLDVGVGGPPDPDRVVEPLSLAYIKKDQAAAPLEWLTEARGLIAPVPALCQGAPRMGFFNTVSDGDGIIRRVPLLAASGGKVYPSLALATVMRAVGLKTALATVSSSGFESLKLADGLVIPMDAKGRMLLNFRGGGQPFPSVSAADILRPGADLSAFEGKIVFVGASAAGLRDLRATPFGSDRPGVEAHATIVDNILTQDFLSRPGWVDGLEFAASLAVGLLATLLLTWTSAGVSLVPALCLGAGCWYGAVEAMTRWRLHASPLYPMMVLAVSFTALTFLKFMREERRRKFIHTAFSRYVSPQVVAQLVEAPDSLNLQGVEREVSILFSDIRGFTSLSEKLSPTQTVSLLHDYLTPMTEIIMERRGTIDKFIGDAIMAFWNAPIATPNHQIEAVESCLGMIEALAELNKGFVANYGFPVDIGIGLHCGVARVGNMGSAKVFNYTLIGDNVNLASRLEGLTKYYGQRILVSDAVREVCGDRFVFVELDRVRVKGKERPLTIYGVPARSMTPELARSLEAYEIAQQAYHARRFAEAARLYEELLNEGRNKLYEVHLERCRHYTEEPPGDDWDGVYSHTSK